MAKWIWYRGDFEIFHSLKLHSRRQERGCEYPPFWSLSTPYPSAAFYKEYRSEEAETVSVVTYARAYVMVDGVRYPSNTRIDIPAGEHSVCVVAMDHVAFPSIYICGKYLFTDGTWTADHKAGERMSVGCSDCYTSASDDPRIFKFSYERREPVSVSDTAEGRLYDFGREMFGILHIENAQPTESIRVTYGESREEALDYEYAVIRETLSSSESYALAPRAFRYICIDSRNADRLKIYAEYEYLPLEDRGSFKCDNARVNKIWEVCAYTLHLNSREFFLDGIKRDRWVWSGDAYQSYMANNYIFFDPEITKRTIVALLGKPPYEQHINTINDYSMYLIIGAYEYYYATGDAKFICTYYDRLRALYDFINGRLDADGYVCKMGDDWIFIDWSDMDKDGPICAEQILLWRTHTVMSELSAVAGKPEGTYLERADALKKRIMKDFWREERGAFIDCLASGRENVTRHANIFAIMYDFVTAERAEKIVACVLENDAITKITTPYFEFFELMTLCKTGRLAVAQSKIESYWGGMIDLGATSIWEQYIPEQRGAEHYEMYDRKYDRSLCHAWGGGPIYIFGRYALGVYPTDIGYKSFRVEPKLGRYESIEGTVPLPGGNKVTVEMNGKVCKAMATVGGGVLVMGDKEYTLKPHEEICVEL